MLKNECCPLKFTDSHCHINFDEFELTRDSILSSCLSNHIHQLIVPATTPEKWHTLLEMMRIQAQSNYIKESPKIHIALGIHPYFLNKMNNSHVAMLESEVSTHRSKIIAIGETGIDNFIAEKEDNLKKQLHFFSAQIEIAQTHKLPLIIHHRRSHAQVIALLKQHRFSLGGVIHAFSGSYEEAMAYITLGFYIGVGGTITYKRAQKTIRCVSKLPLDRLLLETDSPSMPLYQQQGNINTPLNIIKVFNSLAEHRKESKEVLANQIEVNVKNFLGISVTHL